MRPDHAELPDPIAAVSRAVVATTRRLVRAAWVPWIAVATIVGSAVFAVVRGLTLPDADSSTWVVAMLVAGGAATAVSCAVGLAVRGDRERAFEWFRRGVLASLLVTQVALLRVDEWAGYAMLALDLLLLGLVGAELEVLRARRRDRDVSEAEARVG